MNDVPDQRPGAYPAVTVRGRGDGGKIGRIFQWRVRAKWALARTGECVRGMCPHSEAGRFWIFYTEFVQFGEYFLANFMSLLMFILLSYQNTVYSPLFPLLSLFPFLFLFSFLFFPFSFPFSSFSLFVPFSLLSYLSFPSLPLCPFLSHFFPSHFSPLPDFLCRGSPPRLRPCMRLLSGSYTWMWYGKIYRGRGLHGTP